MALSVVESTVRSRLGDPSLSADLLLVTPHLVAVLSGVELGDRTAHSLSLPRGVTPARFAATVGLAGLRALPEDATMTQAVEALTAGLAGAVARVVPAGQTLQVGFSFAAVSNLRREVWRVGQVAALHDASPEVGRSGLPPSLQAVAGARSLLMHALLAEGGVDASGRPPAALVQAFRQQDPTLPLLAPLWLAHDALVNQPGPLGHGLITGQPVPAEFVCPVTLPPGQREVVLASAGYPQPRPTLAESERLLLDLLRSDPLLVERFPYVRPHRPAQESYADRVYVRVRLW